MCVSTAAASLPIIFLLFTLREGRTFELVSENSNNFKYEGSNVSLECVIKAKAFDFYEYQIIWSKVAAGADDEVQVNTGPVVGEPFKSTNRYSIVRKVIRDDEDDDKVQLHLSIIDVQPEDAGEYRCGIYSSEQKLDDVTHTLVVPAPVEELTLTINTTTGSNDTKMEVSVVAMTTNATGEGHVTYHMKEEDTASVECVARGVGIVPNLWFADHDGLSPFRRVETLTRRGQRGLDVVVYEVRLSADNLPLKMLNTIDKRHLSCIARIPGHQELTRKAVGTVNVRYAPKFECDKEMTVPLGTQDYKMECTIRANPPVRADEVLWQIGDNSTSIISADETSDVFSSTAEVVDGHQLKVALTVEEVTESIYRIYVLSASNSLGQRFHYINLREAPARRQPSVREDINTESSSLEDGDSSSSAAVPHITLVATAILLLYLVRAM